jgi:hypothetical protein
MTDAQGMTRTLTALRGLLLVPVAARPPASRSRAGASGRRAVMATSVPAPTGLARARWLRPPRLSGALYGVGALALAGEAAIHVERFITLFYGVQWIGPLFLANGAACLVAIAGLAREPTRRLAALLGTTVSTLALGALALSYGGGLFGWMESGLSTPIAFALTCEAGAVLALTSALAAR